MDGFFASLDPSYMTSATQRTELFTLVQRAPTGKLWPDGKKWKVVGNLTGRQFRMICDSSATDEEAVERLRLLILEGKDTTRNAPASANTDIEARVQAEVRRILADMNRQIESERLGIEEKIEEVVEPKVRVSKRVEAHELTGELAMWAERSEAMGLGPAKLKKDGTADMRWMRRVQDKWEERNQTAPAQ